jgi:hypothetical protein
MSDIEREFYQSAFDNNKQRFDELFKLLNPTLEMIELACFNAYHSYKPVMMKYIMDKGEKLDNRYAILYNNLIESIKEGKRRAKLKADELKD